MRKFATALYLISAVILMISMYMKGKGEDSDVLFYIGLVLFGGGLGLHYTYHLSQKNKDQ
jgi:intracellular septation protein A